MPESQTYEKPLREIFTDDDLELATRVARVCVLYEDLRIEYWGARAEGLTLAKTGSKAQFFSLKWCQQLPR